MADDDRLDEANRAARRLLVARDRATLDDACRVLIRIRDGARGSKEAQVAQDALEEFLRSNGRHRGMNWELARLRKRVETLDGLRTNELESLLAELFGVRGAPSPELRALRKNALKKFSELADLVATGSAKARHRRVEELTALFGKYSAADPDLSSEWDCLQWLLSMLASDCTNDALLVQLEDALRKCEVDEASRLRALILVEPVPECASRSRIAAAMVELGRRLEKIDQELGMLRTRCQVVGSRLDQLGAVRGEPGSVDWEVLAGIVKSADGLDQLLGEGCIPVDLGHRAREQRAATEIWLLGALRFRIGGCSDLPCLIDCCGRVAALGPAWFNRIEPEWLAPVRDSYKQDLDARLAAATAAATVGELAVTVRADLVLLSAELRHERLCAPFGLKRLADLLERLSVLWRELPTGVPEPPLGEFSDLNLPSQFVSDYEKFAALAVELEQLKVEVEANSGPAVPHRSSLIEDHRSTNIVAPSEHEHMSLVTRMATDHSSPGQRRSGKPAAAPGVHHPTEWDLELRELAAYYETLPNRTDELDTAVSQLLSSKEVDTALMRARYVLEVIVTKLCMLVLERRRGTGPLAAVIDQLAKAHTGEDPDLMFESMRAVNRWSSRGVHYPRDVTGDEVRQALLSLKRVLGWYHTHEPAKVFSSVRSRPKETGDRRQEAPEQAIIRNKPNERLVLTIAPTSDAHLKTKALALVGLSKAEALDSSGQAPRLAGTMSMTEAEPFFARPLPTGKGNKRLREIDQTLSWYRQLYPDYQPIAELSAMVRLKWAAALCDAALSTWNAAELRALLAEEQEAGLGEHYAIYAALVADPQALEDLCDTARVADPADATEAGRWWIRWEGAKRRLPARATWPEAFSAQVADQEDRRRALWLGAIDELLADSSATAEDLGAVADLVAPAVGGLAELGPRVADLAEHELAAYRVRGDLSQIEAFLANAERSGRLVPADVERWGVWVALERLKTVCCRERISIWNTRFAQFVPALGRSAAAALLQLIDECVSPAGDTDPWALFKRIAAVIDSGSLAGDETDALWRRIRLHQCVRRVATGFPAGSSDQAIGPWIELTRCWHGELNEDERAAVRPFIAALVADWRERRDLFALYWAYQVFQGHLHGFPAGGDPGQDLRNETALRVTGLRQRLGASAGFPDDAVWRAVRDECEGLAAGWRHLAVCVSEAPIPTDPIAAPDGLANLVRDLGHLMSAADAIAALRVADYLADQTDKLFHDCESAAMALERDGFAAGAVCREELNRLSELFAARFHYRHFRESAARLKRRDTLHETGAYQPLIGDVKAIADAVGRAALTNPEQQNRLLANALLRVLESEGEECPHQGQDRDLTLVVGCLGDLERVEESTIENIKALENARPLVGNIDPERAEYAGFFALFPAVPPGSKRQRQRYCRFVQREPMRQILRRAERRLPKWLQTVCADQARQGPQC